MYELLKAKRNADSHYRKIKLAFEGPKNPSRSRANEKKKEAEAFGEAKESEETASGKKGKGSKENQDNTGDSEKAPPKFKPTATQKQFVSRLLMVACVAMAMLDAHLYVAYSSRVYRNLRQRLSKKHMMLTRKAFVP